MNNIIAASRLAEILAMTANIPHEEAEKFVREYFGEAFNILASGEDLELKGIGTFSLTGNPDSPVIFTVDRGLEQEVNAPFDAFTPFDLGDDELPADTPPSPPAPPVVPTEVTEEETVSVSEEPPVPPAAPVVEAPVVDGKMPPAPPQTTADVVVEELPPVVPAGIPADEQPPVYDGTTVEPAEADADIPPAPVESDEENEADSRYDSGCDSEGDSDEEAVPPYEGPVHHHHHHRHQDYHRPTPRKTNWTWTVFALVVGLIIGFAVGFFFHQTFVLNINGRQIYTTEENGKLEYIDTVDEEEDAIPEAPASATAEEAPAEAAAQAPAAAAEDTKHPSAAPVYDTVTSTTFLTTLARKHYGTMEYWVYIYEANPGLGNPNTIKPGTRVVIPDKSELPLTGNRETDIAQAKKKSAAIYARYAHKK